MKKRFIATVGVALFAFAGSLNAQVIIENLDVRSGGVFGHDVNLGGTPQTGVTINGLAPPTDGSAVVADPLDIALTYNELDLDGDGSANDSVSFTINVTGGTNAAGDPFQRAFNQGIDTGFGNLNDVTVSVTGVSGTTTDSGATIYFDGFTGAGVGAGTGAANGLDRSAEINGTTVTFDTEPTGAFQFVNMDVDFAAPVQSVLFDNSGGIAGPGTEGLGSLVARRYDLQFSLTEPTGGVLGDFDGNGLVELADLDEYSGNIGLAVAANPGLADLDLDGNGTIEAADLEQHYTDLVGTSNGGTGTVAGDADLNGVVDVLGDAAALINNLGPGATSWAQGDFNADGVVDVLGDAAALINNLGADNGGGAGAPATSAVPEPGSLSLLALAGLGAIVRRRR